MSDYSVLSHAPWENNSAGITLVEIRPGVTSIGNLAFYSCGRLRNVIIPDSVNKIGEDAFYECDSLKSIRIPDSVTNIGDGAFSVCENLTDIQVSYGNAFYTAENGVLYNREKTKLIVWPTAHGNVVIPNGITSIGNNAFEKCNNLKHVEFPEGLTDIGDHAFGGCYKLENITIPDRVTYIGSNSFSACFNMRSAVIGNNVTSIGDCAFWLCRNMLSVTVGKGVVRIGRGVFNQCRSLNSVTFRGNAPDFDGCAFEGVNAAVYYPAGNPTWTGKVLQNYGGAPRWIACEPKGEDASRAGERYPAGASLRNGRVNPSATEDPGKMLSQLLADFPDAVTDRKRLNALLQDYMPNEKMIRNTLLLAFDEGIVENLRLNTLADKLTIHRYERQLTDAYGLAGVTAEQAVELWINALGIDKI